MNAITRFLKTLRRGDAREICTVKSVVRLCDAFPTQYELKLVDGRIVNAMFNRGRLEVGISPGPTDRIEDAICGELIYVACTGDARQGLMSEEHFSNHLGLAGIALAPNLSLK